MLQIGPVNVLSPLQSGNDTPATSPTPEFGSANSRLVAPCLLQPLGLQKPQPSPSVPSNLGLWPGRSELQCLVDGLYITNYFGAKKLDNLVKAGITHVVVCAAELDKVFEKKIAIKYLKLELADNTNVNLTPILAKSLPWMRDAIETGGRVLVHCAAGASRSGTIALAYIMATRHLTFAEALVNVQKIRPLIQPNQDFCRQLSDFDCGGLLQSPASSK